MKNEIDILNEQLGFLSYAAGDLKFSEVGKLVVILDEDDFTLDMQRISGSKKRIEPLSRILTKAGIENQIACRKSVREWFKSVKKEPGEMGMAAAYLYVRLKPERVKRLMEDQVSCEERGVQLEVLRL